MPLAIASGRRLRSKLEQDWISPRDRAARETDGAGMSSRNDSIGALDRYSSNNHIDTAVVVTKLQCGLQRYQDALADTGWQDVFNHLLLGRQDVVHGVGIIAIHGSHCASTGAENSQFADIAIEVVV